MLCDADPNSALSTFLSGLPEPRDIDESTANEEMLLSRFLKLHPMISNDAFSWDILNQLSEFVHTRPLAASELPVVGKSYEDSYLRPPNTTAGERSCVLGDNCLCNYVAQVRHGLDSPLAFICTEFLLPDESATWRAGGGLPRIRNKCLICLRYFTTFTYLMARMDPEFRMNINAYSTQTHQNVPTSMRPCAPTTCSDCHSAPQTDKGAKSKALDGDGSSRRRGGSRPTSRGSSSGARKGSAPYQTAYLDAIDCPPHELTTADLPRHANLVDAHDGYSRDAMVFVEEALADHHSVRSSAQGLALLWRPFVRFNAEDYEFLMTPSGLPVAVQRNIACSSHLNDPAPSELSCREVPKAGQRPSGKLRRVPA